MKRKFKEIKEGVAICCYNEQQAQELLSYLYDLGYTKILTDNPPPPYQANDLKYLNTCFQRPMTMYQIRNKKYVSIYSGYHGEQVKIVDFDDIVEPLTLNEFIEFYKSNSSIKLCGRQLNQVKKWLKDLRAKSPSETNEAKHDVKECKWIRVGTMYDSDFPPIQVYQCSLCRRNVNTCLFLNITLDNNYCPFCGAKVVERIDKRKREYDEI